MNPPTALRFRSSLATHVRWYALSVVLSAVALSLMVLLRPLMEHSSFFLFLAAVSVSAIYGGLQQLAKRLTRFASSQHFS